VLGLLWGGAEAPCSSVDEVEVTRLDGFDVSEHVVELLVRLEEVTLGLATDHHVADGLVELLDEGLVEILGHHVADKLAIVVAVVFLDDGVKNLDLALATFVRLAGAGSGALGLLGGFTDGSDHDFEHFAGQLELSVVAVLAGELVEDTVELLLEEAGDLEVGVSGNDAVGKGSGVLDSVESLHLLSA